MSEDLAAKIQAELDEDEVSDDAERDAHVAKGGPLYE